MKQGLVNNNSNQREVMLYEDITNRREFKSPHFKRKFGLMSRVFASGLGDRGSIPGQVIPKTQKMALDAALLSTQHYKVRIKGKVEQS